MGLWESAEKIVMAVDEYETIRLIDKEGFSQEYGAREIERVLNSRITPLLMREILFGRKEGFTAVISLEGNDFSIR